MSLRALYDAFFELKSVEERREMDPRTLMPLPVATRSTELDTRALATTLAAAEGLTPVTPSSPVAPVASPVTVPTPDAEWAAAAKAAGFAPRFLVHDEFRAILADLGVMAYDWDEVVKYLDAAIAKLNDRPRAIRWGWTLVPLRHSDAQRYQANSYDQPVPLHVLQLVARIAERAPNAMFSVTAIAQQPKADPFLVVQADFGAPYFAIAQWDEPAFRAEPKEVRP